MQQEALSNDLKGKSGQRKGLPLTASEPNNDKSSAKKVEKIEKNNTHSSDSEQHTPGTKTNVSEHKSHSKNNRSHSPPAISKVKYKEEKVDESQTSKKSKVRKSTDDASSSINYLDSNPKPNKNRRGKPLRIQSTPHIGDISKGQIQYSRARNFCYDFSDSESSVAEVIPSSKSPIIRENSSSELLNLSKKNQKFDCSDSEPLNALRDSLSSYDTKSRSSDPNTPLQIQTDSPKQSILAAASREKYQNQESKKAKFANKQSKSLNPKVDMSDSDTSVAVCIPPSKSQRPSTVYIDRKPALIKISKNEYSDGDNSPADKNPPSKTQRPPLQIRERPTNNGLKKGDSSESDTSVAEQIPPSKMQRPKTTVFSKPPILNKFGRYNDSDSDTSVAEQIPPSKMQRPKTTTFEKSPVAMNNKKVMISEADTKNSEKKPLIAQSRAAARNNIVDSSDSDSVAIQIPPSKMKRPQTTFYAKPVININNKNSFTSDSDTSVAEQIPHSQVQKDDIKKETSEDSDTSVAVQIPHSKMSRPKTVVLPHPPVKLKKDKVEYSEYDSDCRLPPKNQRPPANIINRKQIMSVQFPLNRSFNWSDSDSSVAEVIPPDELRAEKIAYLKAHPEATFENSPSSQISECSSCDKLKSLDNSEADSSQKETMHQKFQKIDLDVKNSPPKKVEQSESDPSFPVQSSKSEVSDSSCLAITNPPKPTEFESKSDVEPSKLSNENYVAPKDNVLQGDNKKSSNVHVTDDDRSYNSASSSVLNKESKKKSHKRRESSGKNSNDGKDKKKKSNEEHKPIEQKDSQKKSKEKAKNSENKKEESDSDYYSYSYNYYSYTYTYTENSTSKDEKNKNSTKKK